MKFHVFVELLLLSVLTVFLTFCFAQFGLVSTSPVKLETSVKEVQEPEFDY